MPAFTMACAACSWPVPRELWNREEGVRCSQCGHTVQVLAFPAVDKNSAGSSPEALQGETEASCFYHPQNRAAIPCDECGRFLCALCDLDVDGLHICPRCFETVGAPKVETRRTMYDTVALALATLPVLLFWPVLIGAPWALFVIFRRWNTPLSILPRTKIRFILAGIFALAEVGVVIFFIYMLMQVSLHPPARTPPPSTQL